MLTLFLLFLLISDPIFRYENFLSFCLYEAGLTLIFNLCRIHNAISNRKIIKFCPIFKDDFQLFSLTQLYTKLAIYVLTCSLTLLILT